MQPHPDVVTLVLGKLGGHSETGDGYGGGVGGEVGAHGKGRGACWDGGREEEDGEKREGRHGDGDETTGD